MKRITANPTPTDEQRAERAEARLDELLAVLRDRGTITDADERRVLAARPSPRAGRPRK
jgi:hypothetical protein